MSIVHAKSGVIFVYHSVDQYLSTDYCNDNFAGDSLRGIDIQSNCLRYVKHSDIVDLSFRADAGLRIIPGEIIHCP